MILPLMVRWSGSVASLLATLIFKKKLIQDLNINFQVINTTELYILFKIVSFIILVTFVAFCGFSVLLSIHPLFPDNNTKCWQMVFTQTQAIPLHSSKEKHHSFFILAPSSYLNPPAYESVYYTYTPCKSSNSLMSNPKNNFGFISRVNSISFANTSGIWTRDKLVYFLHFSIGMAGLNSHGVMILQILTKGTCF